VFKCLLATKYDKTIFFKNSFQNSILPTLCENVEQNVSKTDVIDSIDNHDDGLFSNQLDQLNQLVNTNDIIVCPDFFIKFMLLVIVITLQFLLYRNEGK